MNSNTFSNVFYKGETLANRIREDIKNIKSLSKRKKPNPIFDNLYNRSPTVIRYNHVNIFKNVNCPKSHKKIENYTVNNQTFINSSILKMKDVMSKSKDQFKNKRLLSLTSKLKEELDIYQNKKGIKYEEESFFMNNSFSIMKSNNFDDLITKNSEVKLNYIINKK